MYLRDANFVLCPNNFKIIKLYGMLQRATKTNIDELWNCEVNIFRSKARNKVHIKRVYKCKGRRRMFSG